MHKLKKIIRRVRYLGDTGKMLLAVSMLIWFSIAALPARWLVPNTFEGVDDCMPASRCATSDHYPPTHTLHIEVVYPGSVKPAHRPARFGFPKSDS